ncbi:hypothetical protein ACPL2J_08760 [Escherichia coli]|uniref:hypothetical protein n=1 Tax=Escherichia coli TaxID=562 RepID=UPI003C710C46
MSMIHDSKAEDLEAKGLYLGMLRTSGLRYHRRLCAYGGCYGGLPTTQNCGGTVGLPR